MILRSLILVLAMASATASLAATHNMKYGQVYIGQELYNERPTGEQCFVTINFTHPLYDKGLHCHTALFTVNTNRTDIPEVPLSVESRITNYHTPEYPELKSCATNVDGTTFGPELYAESSDRIYNHIFSGTHKENRTQYDYFLTISAETKLPTRTRIHVLEWFKEYDVDCVNLKQM
ncbi:MAG: hypothetical protein CL675_06185 [Bdellovibrionaceae bacterium]|mgnify:CR=1 FL=1|nr:hypothetical protein [Pseudobdellovibrionaceae bacterium]